MTLNILHEKKIFGELLAYEARAFKGSLKTRADDGDFRSLFHLLAASFTFYPKGAEIYVC